MVPEQQSSAFGSQASVRLVQHDPSTQIWSCTVQQTAGEPQQTAPVAQVPQLLPQPSSPHPLVPAQLGVQQVLLKQVWPEAQQVPPQHVLPKQQSLSPLHVPSPLGIQLTQVPLDSSQIPEQHWMSAVQGPSFAIQQVPLLHILPVSQQVSGHA
jgi:hypothetical protein